jgi:hypothetical protein
VSAPRVRGGFVPAHRIIDALGSALLRIKQEDELTWPDMGAAIGKSDDRAALYASGAATMDVVTYYRAKQAFNGRFTGEADKLVDGARGVVDPHQAQSCILRATLALSVALEDGDLTDSEIAANRTNLVNARDAIDGLLCRLAPKRVG